MSAIGRIVCAVVGGVLLGFFLSVALHRVPSLETSERVVGLTGAGLGLGLLVASRVQRDDTR